MRTLNLSGFKPADSLSISVSQGAITAGPYSVPAWGGGGGGGTIAVNAIHRSQRQMAPDSVRFEVDLSASNFDTPGPVGDEVYDARLHDLIYLWDLGDPGFWTAPVNVPPAWKNRNVAKGPSVRHVYRDPGDYTVSVLVVEPSTGKTATASTSITVSDPQDYFGDTNTIYVNNIGDSDFSDVPAGVPAGNKLNINELGQIGVIENSVFVSYPDATWVQFKNTSTRWRFKRGGSWTVGLYLHGGDAPELLFDDYGDPQDDPPEFVPFDDGARPIFRFGYSWGWKGAWNGAVYTPTTYAGEFRTRNIHFQGNFDSRVYTGMGGTNQGAVYCVGAIDLVMVDCTFDGLGASNVYCEAGNTTPDYIVQAHFDNCVLTNFGGQYPLMLAGSRHAKSGAAFTGVRWEQPGDAVWDGPGYQGSRACLRTGVMFNHLRGCDGFHTDSSQPLFSPLKTPLLDGAIINIHSCASEGGAVGISMCGNYAQTPEQRAYVHNMIIDGYIHIGGPNTYIGIEAIASGLTVRNCLIIIPAMTKFGNSLNGFVSLESRTPSTLPSKVADAPIAIYNNTFRMDRNQAQNGNWVFDIINPHQDYSGFNDIQVSNNVLHVPNLTGPGYPTLPYTVFAPLSESILWTPRSLGRRDPVTLALDTSWATPVDAAKDSKPLPGSVALGAALTDNVSYMDILGTTRTAPADKGAWVA